MDDGADLTSIIRLKPLKSEPEENGRERKRGREREGESERKRRDGQSSRFFGLLGMHNWINLNCNESTVLDGFRTRFSPESLSIVVPSRYRAKNQRYRIVLRIQSDTRENNRKEDGRSNLLGCTAQPTEYNNSFRLSSLYFTVVSDNGARNPVCVAKSAQKRKRLSSLGLTSVTSCRSRRRR